MHLGIRASLVYNNIHCAVNPKITLFKAQELSIQCDRSHIYRVMRSYRGTNE